MLPVSSSIIPIIHGRPRSQPFFERLAVLLFAFGPSFIILSISYEALFYGCFSTMLCLWLLLETKLAQDRLTKSTAAQSKVKENGRMSGGVEMEHVRIALVFLLLLHTAFFGVGNVASISSVSPPSVITSNEVLITRMVNSSTSNQYSA